MRLKTRLGNICVAILVLTGFNNSLAIPPLKLKSLYDALWSEIGIPQNPQISNNEDIKYRFTIVPAHNLPKTVIQISLKSSVSNPQERLSEIIVVDMLPDGGIVRESRQLTQRETIHWLNLIKRSELFKLPRLMEDYDLADDGKQYISIYDITWMLAQRKTNASLIEVERPLLKGSPGWLVFELLGELSEGMLER